MENEQFSWIPYFPDVGQLNQMLEASTRRCIFKVNGVCQTGCPVREYCRPEANGLVDVKDMAVEMSACVKNHL